MSVKFLNGYVKDGRVELLYRNDSGALMARRVPAECVSYMRRTEVAKHEHELRRSAYVTGVAEEGDWLRVRWRDYDSRKAVCGPDGPMAQHGIPTYEADVGPVRRYIIDHAIEVARPRRAYFDIETDSRVSLAEKEKMRVLCWSIVDDDGNTTTGVLEADTDDAERALLEEMWTALDAFDQIIAWYGDGFDFPVIQARTKAVRAKVKEMRRWLYLDHLVLFKRMNMHSAESGDEKQSMALQNIAMAVVGEGKDDFDARKTYDAWAAGGAERQRMVDYNRKDTMLLKRIEEKTGYISLFQTLCEVCHLFPDTVSLNPTAQVDSFMLRLGRERGQHFPTKFHTEVVEGQQFAGAFVMEPTAHGIVKDVHVGDFSSMYPSIIITWNMSPETMRRIAINGPIPDGHCRAPSTRLGFVNEPQGFLASAVAEMLRLRKEWNDRKAACPPGTSEWKDADRRSTAYKVAANSFYGVVGSPFSRFYNREIAESVTTTGVWLIKRTIDFAKAEGMATIYADTDSCFIAGATKDQFDDFVKRCNGEHYPRLIAETGAVRGNVALAYEKQFERIVFTGKKRYIGKYKHFKGKPATDDSKPEIKGLEYKRGDTALLARKLQERVINMLMQRCEDPVAFEPVVIAAIEHALRPEPLPLTEVQLSKSLNKDLSEYAVRTKKDGGDFAALPHIMLARVLMQRQAIALKRKAGSYDVPAGTRIEYVVTDSLASPTEVIWGPEYDGKCDRYYLWESLVYPPTLRLLEAAFPAHDWQRFAKVRPKKVRAAPVPKPKPDSPQLGLSLDTPPQTGLRLSHSEDGVFAGPSFNFNSYIKPSPAPTPDAPPAVPAMRKRGGPFVVRLRGADYPQEAEAKAAMRTLNAIFARHPGGRDVQVEIDVEGVIAVMSSPIRVSVTPLLLEAVRQALGRGAA